MSDYAFEKLRENIEDCVIMQESNFKIIRSHFRHEKVKRYTFLLKPGQVCEFEIFVCKGTFEKFLYTSNKKRIVEFAIDGSWISDWNSLSKGLPSPYYIESLELSEILIINKISLYTLFDQLPMFERFYRIKFQKSIEINQKKFQCLQNTVSERYYEFKKSYGYLEQRVSQSEIASFLGMSRESLSRLKSNNLSNHKKI